MIDTKSKYCLKVCKSRCCKKLYLSISPEELEKNYMDWLLQTGEKTRQEIYLLYPMLEYVKKIKREGVARPYEYRCKHLVNEKCSIYKIRPKMCSGFGTVYEADADEKCIYSKKFKK